MRALVVASFLLAFVSGSSMAGAARNEEKAPESVWASTEKGDPIKVIVLFKRPLSRASGTEGISTGENVISFPDDRIGSATIVHYFETAPMAVVLVPNKSALEDVVADPRVTQVYENSPIRTYGSPVSQ